MGRLPKGALTVWEENADIIVFGTGASKKDGKVEAAWMRDTLIERFFELPNFSAFQKISLEDLKSLKKKIEKNSRLEIRSKNTKEEIKFAGEVFIKEGVEKVFIVSSPDHVSRCIRDAYLVYSEEKEFNPLAKRLFATPSQIPYTGRNVGDVKIIEPRPDQ
jgi:hypothetical protein